MRIAYLNSQYPALSHTFIEREVRAVRAAGLEIRTFSIRRPVPAGLLCSHHQVAADETAYICDGAAPLIWSLLKAIVSRPGRVLRTLREGQKLSPPGIRRRLKHSAYALEAVRFAQLMRQADIRHVHVHMANNGAMVALLATAFDSSLSYSLTVHGPADFYDVHELRLADKTRHAAFVRCISEFCRSQVMLWSDAHVWHRIHVVHCGVDTDLYRPPVASSGNGLRLLTVGRLAPIKGYPLLLRACRHLIDEGIDLTLELVGDGPIRDELEQLTDELAISDRVSFAGAVGQDRIQEHYDRADVMVISSFMEGVPVVLMEAMAKGLAVVATRVAGIAELVDDGVSGWLVNPSSVEELVRGIRAASANRDQLPVMGGAGRQRVASDFSIKDVGGAMTDLFRHYLQEERAAQVAHGRARYGHREEIIRTDGMA